MNNVKKRVEITIKIFSALVRIFIYSVIPFTLTLVSAFYICYAPTVVGNLCGPAGDEFCYQPLPQAGFPFSYWIDQAGISSSWGAWDFKMKYPRWRSAQISRSIFW